MRCLIPVTALTIVAAGCTATTAVDVVDDPFELYELATSPAKHQTLLFGSFDGQAPLAVVRVDGTGQRHVHLVAFDGSNGRGKRTLRSNRAFCSSTSPE